MRTLALFTVAGVALAQGLDAEVPRYGCGLLGNIPGIKPDGSATPEAQKVIDGLKATSSYGKVSYWNWNLAPKTEYLTKDFIFMPEQWGPEAVNETYVRTAMKPNFLDGNGKVSPATMGDIFLGANEPDMTGSCQGTMMGRCTAPCTDAEVKSGDCPVCHLKGPPAQPNAAGHCDCVAGATSSGFWSVDGCSALQPLPTLWSDAGCVASVMAMWKQTAATVTAKGYTYLSTPLVATDMDWLENFVRRACTGCSSISCGCPTHVAWHFYAEDCRPNELGGYKDFQAKLDRTVQIMEEFPHLQGAIINEVGMLNCNTGGDQKTGACIPNGPTQKFPAANQVGNACPTTGNPDLPNGLAQFVTELLKMVAKAKTSDGRLAVASFSWFNEDMTGGTYNLQLFDGNGNVNALGEALISACQEWTASMESKPVVV